MTSKPFFTLEDPALNYVFTHVFLPVKVPDKCDYTISNDIALARAVRTALDAYTFHIDDTLKPQWGPIIKMLDRLEASLQSGSLSKDNVVSRFRSMQSGDILVFLIQVQRAAVIFRKREDCTLFEAFETSPSRDALRKTGGRLICSYGTAVEIPNKFFDDTHFQIELAEFLSLPYKIDPDPPTVPSTRPEYITALLTGILRSVGRKVEGPHVRKHVRDELGDSEKQEDEWRRSSLWLLIRVAIQTSLERSSAGHTSYKSFLLFFMCKLAKEANDAGLPSNLLYLISTKVLRRLSKLGSSSPDWLSEIALETCRCLQGTLDVRGTELQAAKSPPYWNPCELDLIKDTQLSLPHCGEYVRGALSHPSHTVVVPFHPKEYHRGTLEDFLSADMTFFEKAYSADPYVALYDVEQAVEHDLGSWVTRVSNVDEACDQLVTLMDIYLSSASIPYADNPEYRSIMTLTALELWVALDQLVVEEIPILADYSPEIPTSLLELLLLREATNLHRLSHVFQYLSARHSGSRAGFSVLSDEITQNSFPVRYYDGSSVLQSLKGHIEAGIVWKGAEGREGPATLALTFRNDRSTPQGQYDMRQPDGSTVTKLVSMLPLQIKVVAMELQCPVPFRIWRSATSHLLYRFDKARMSSFDITIGTRPHDLVSDVPELQPYIIRHPCQQLLSSSQFELAFFHPEGLDLRIGTRLGYVFQWTSSPNERSRWWGVGNNSLSQHTTYYNFFDDLHGSCLYGMGGTKRLAKYVGDIDHTSNDVLSAQFNCPFHFSLDEFIAFGHLRSGASLQWLNILRELRGKTLNFCSHEVHFLLTQATSHVGPLDSETGEWAWHRELQYPPFCNAFLNELESTFLDVSAASLDEVSMHTISMLLTRILVSSCCETIFEQALQILRDVRKKILEWVQDLSYNLIQAATNDKRRRRLRNMAATCRSTFDVGASLLPIVLRSTEDVQAMMACAFFVQATSHFSPPRNCDQEGCSYGHFSSSDIRDYSRLLLERDRRLSVSAEQVLRDVILADATNRGIDLAVRDIWPGYQPGPQTWQSENHPNRHWLVCTTAQTAGRIPQTVRVNLLDGSLLVDGRSLAGLPREIREHPLYIQIFRGQALLVFPSELPGMEFATVALISGHSVHFSLRGDDLVIRAYYKDDEDISDVLELVPPEILKRELPSFLIKDHAHWLNLSTSVIEIRPLKTLWDKSGDNWMIFITPGKYHAHKGSKFLVDMQSPTWKMVSDLLICLEDPEDLMVTTSTVDSSSSPHLSVALPHLGLSFFVNSGSDLESDDFKDMVYDKNQDIGTLFGLENRLILRTKQKIERGVIPRRVLVPVPPFVSFSYPHGVQYHAYKVDTELGCLTGDPSYQSRNFLAHLHTKTSIDWKPDPLTGKTGSQEALSILASAGYQSLTQLPSASSYQYIEDFSIPLWYPQLIIEANRDTLDSLFERRRVLQWMRGARRGQYLSPQNVTLSIPQELSCDMQYSCSLPDHELEDTAYTAASVIHHLSTDELTCLNAIPNWADIWSNAMDRDVAHSPSPFDGERWNPKLPHILSLEFHNILQECNDSITQQAQLLFRLPVIAFCSSHPYTSFLSMLLGFSKQHQQDNYADFKFLDGYFPTEKVLKHHINAARNLDIINWEEDYMWYEVDVVVEHLLRAWPNDAIPLFELDSETWDIGKLTTTLQTFFSSCYRNLKLKEDLKYALQGGSPQLQTIGRSLLTHDHALWAASINPAVSSNYFQNSSSLTSPSSNLSPHTAECPPWRVTLDQVLSKRHAPSLPCLIKLVPNESDDNKGTFPNSPAFRQLLSSLRTNREDPSFRERYIAGLHASARHVRMERRSAGGAMKRYPIDTLAKHFLQCEGRYMDALHILKGTLSATVGTLEQTFALCGQWPHVTADSLLRCLASTSPVKLSDSWKHCLVSFALLLLEWQRARRLLRFASEELEGDLEKELENEGCDGWDAEEHPDWLLIQIQGDLLIRRYQANTAMEIISPQSGENTVMQVNMGEGKSSVIIPIAAATLANGSQLVRVIVPKALMVQMLHLMVERLGGLAGRSIYHLRYYRSHFTRKMEVEGAFQTLSRYMEECGILVLWPENVLSLRLMGVEKQLIANNLATQSSSRLQKLIHQCDAVAFMALKFMEDSYLSKVLRALCDSFQYSATEHDIDDVPQSVASEFLELQKWLHLHARDILDESDEILHPRRQLIYTLGHPQHVEGYPDRWTIIQQILRLVKRHAFSLSQDLPDSVEYGSRGPGSFPYFRVLRASSAGRRLILMLVGDIMAGYIPALNFGPISETQRDTIQSFISSENVQSDRAKEVEEYARCSQQSNLWSNLLLLRGLFASDILLFALTGRRWRVDYGLPWHPQYLPFPAHSLAVPYRAKDVPSQDTQFGHPDLTILLTCLSYYYSGLNKKQLRLAFQILLTHDNPTTEYELWVQDCGPTLLPPSVRNLKGFNLESSEQWDKHLFPNFSHNQAAIDFYLSRVVFPQEAKEYPWKLAASSWDLGEKRGRLITGFSGTNDGRYLLPIPITQHDLHHQQGSNARVLGHLLQPENDCYVVTIDENGQPVKTPAFLKMVVTQQPEIRVVLDVGAQILGASNRDFAEEWLHLTSAAGAVYFDERDTLMVLTRQGTSQTLMSSSLIQQLDRCVIYLDDAHTRGTDLKFPDGFRAAVTLGPKVTKDRLVQGCMRMRKLGYGHSVMFFAPLEVDQGIRSVTNKEDRSIRITTADILKWAIHETWSDIEQRAPYWAQQGMSHKNRCDAWDRFCNKEIVPEELANHWLQPEFKSLADLYAPVGTTSSSGSTSSRLETDIARRCEDLGVAKSSFESTRINERLEREVNREVEREREVELPPKAEPAEHFLHPDLVAFVKTGTLRASDAFRPVFTSLEKSSAATSKKRVWSPFILATSDFCEVIKQIPANGRVDQYLRPVQWILSGRKGGDRVLVVLSPFEVDSLLPDIRRSKYVHLHIYTPRTSSRMKPTDDLMLYTIPPVPDDWQPPWDLIDQLNVFSGQLYLRDWGAYVRLTRFLVPQKKTQDNKGSVVPYNLFTMGSRKEFENVHPDSLLPSVMMLLAIRRRGLPFSETHMGKLLQGRSLVEKDFVCPDPHQSSDIRCPLR